MMKIVALEEHVVFPFLLDAWKVTGAVPEIAQHGYGDEPIARRLRDTGAARVADMDAMGVDVQVLSVTTPGTIVFGPDDAVVIARECNNALADVVAARPDRIDAFATLPTSDPIGAAAELERAVQRLGLRGALVYGRTGERNADHASFEDLYATAARLRVPLYLHPQMPPKAVASAYYAGFGEPLDTMFASFGLGWYYETGVQLLRMIFAGVFDRNPGLQVIVGHWGELILFYLEHTAVLQTMGLKLERPLIDYFRQNVWITGSGLLSERYMRWALEVVGPGRIMYSTDYPFTFDTGYDAMTTKSAAARRFIEEARFDKNDRHAIASGNWQLAGNVRRCECVTRLLLRVRHGLFSFDT
jgi:predicted TIM-barrel fold metal-dependent hydrolase